MIMIIHRLARMYRRFIEFLRNNSGIFRCTFPFYGNQCELNQCQNHCQNNGSCLINGTDLICK